MNQTTINRLVELECRRVHLEEDVNSYRDAKIKEMRKELNAVNKEVKGIVKAWKNKKQF